MLKFQEFDEGVATAVIEKFLKHTWYLNQEYAPFSLFSTNVDDQEKYEIAQKLSKYKSQPIQR